MTMNTAYLSQSATPLPLSVLIVCADSGPVVRECIGRLLAGSRPLEVILVDNASRDGMPQAIAAQHAGDPRLGVIYSATNLGFGPAMNRAAAQARGKVLAILNPDCLVTDPAMRRLLAILDEAPEAGLLGAVICDEQGRVEPATWRRDPLFHRAVNSLLGRAGDSVNIVADIPAQTLEVEAVSGALMLLPLQVYRQLGGFDEAFFLHCEDLDLCRRVRDAGYKVLLAGDVRVEHGKGSSSRHRPIFVSRYKHRGMWRWFRKHDPAARSRLLSVLVWLGIWTHFLLKIPAQLWRLSRR